MQTTQTQSMLLVTGSWQGQETFKMIPVMADCPFNEAIFVPGSNMLAVVGKEKKDELKRVPRLDENGDPVPMKIAARPNGNPFKEQRIVLPSYYEYYVITKEEITDFVTRFGINAATFDIEKFFIPAQVEGIDLETAGTQAAFQGKKSSLIIAP
jgi:hypothetical protein